MAHGVSEVLGEGSAVKMVHQTAKQQPVQQQQQNVKKSVGVMGSRRIFAPAFKLKVLDSYRNDIDCRGNQRATARKYGIHRRQIQKWLQCEENLRSSCAETTSSTGGNVVATSTSSSGVVVVSKPEETLPAEPTTPAAAPALNLSLGRLHGDELAARQGPPPPHPRPSRRGSPSSPHYVPQTTILPLYPEYSAPQDQQHCLRVEYEDRVRVPEVPCYRESPESSYYMLAGDNHRDGTNYAGRNDAKVYQTLGNAYEASEMIVATAVDQSPTHHHRNYRSSQGDVISSVDGKTYGLLLAPSMIKTERASPDSAATPGPCEPALSPGTARAPPAAAILSDPANSGSNSTSVHFESPQSSPGAHVLVHEHQHGRTGTPDSEKPRLQEGDHATIDGRLEERAREETNVRIEGSIVKEEMSITSYVVKVEKEEEEEEEDVTKDEENVDVGSSCRDYQRPPVTSSSASPHNPSGPTSPLTNDRETLSSVYSLPSSPRGPNSSGRSTSSCSDSEMDALDCLTGSQNSPGDLTRRRSFSLRFKLDVLDAFHRDSAVAGNQRATARKFGINRRQVQKWLGQETELRGEIALRGNSRQRLGPIQDSVAGGGESPVDLRTTTTTTGNYGIPDHGDMDYEGSPRPVGYCCDIGSSSSSSSSQLPYYPRHPADLSPEMETRTCTMACCVDYQEARTGLCYAEPPAVSYCYSPRDSHQDSITVHDVASERTSPLKRSHCTLACCYDFATSPKRLCLEMEEPTRNSVQDPPPQETPLCLVKPKRNCELEPVSSTVPTPPASAAPAAPVQTSKKDAILFKPYLDNPVSKPKDHNRGPSPNNGHNVYVNNNNCQSICNLNENRGHDFALELSLRVPISWRTHQSPYSDFPQEQQNRKESVNYLSFGTSRRTMEYNNGVNDPVIIRRPAESLVPRQPVQLPSLILNIYRKPRESCAIT